MSRAIACLLLFFILLELGDIKDALERLSPPKVVQPITLPNPLPKISCATGGPCPVDSGRLSP